MHTIVSLDVHSPLFFGLYFSYSWWARVESADVSGFYRRCEGLNRANHKSFCDWSTGQEPKREYKDEVLPEYSMYTTKQSQRECTFLLTESKGAQR